MNANVIKEANKLIKDVNVKLDKWNERSPFKIKGVGNLSRSDLDTLLLYAENAIKHPDDPERGFMKLRGGIREIFVAYGILEE